MQRLIAIVLPDPVAIFIASRWRFGLGRVDHERRLRVLDQVGERGSALDLGEVDERLDRLALAEEEPKRLPGRSPVVFLEPEAEQAQGGPARARIAVGAPGVHRSADPVDEVGSFAWPPMGSDPVGIGVGAWGRGAVGHLTATSASFVVSLPKMSMILTTIVCRPASSYSCGSLSRASFGSSRVR